MPSKVSTKMYLSIYHKKIYPKTTVLLTLEKCIHRYKNKNKNIVKPIAVSLHSEFKIYILVIGFLAKLSCGNLTNILNLLTHVLLYSSTLICLITNIVNIQ